MERLAPELEIDRTLGVAALKVRGRDQWFTWKGLYQTRELVFSCCSWTFDHETDKTPWIEKALTLYLYWKLYPERFEARDLPPSRTGKEPIPKPLIAAAIFQILVSALMVWVAFKVWMTTDALSSRLQAASIDSLMVLINFAFAFYSITGTNIFKRIAGTAKALHSAIRSVIEAWPE